MNKNIPLILISVILLINIPMIYSGNISFLEKIEHNKKIANNNGLIISSDAEVSCYFKPDNVNDGYKTCEVIIEIDNHKGNEINLQSSINKFQLDFAKDHLKKEKTVQKKNIINYSFSENYTIYQEKLINQTCLSECNLELIKPNKDCMEKCSYEVSRRGWYNWTDISKKDFNKLQNNKLIGIKLIFEIPQYESNSFNFTLKGNEDYKLDPDISACGTINLAGTYTQTANIIPTSSSDCIIINSSNVIFNGNGYWITNTSYKYSGSFISAGNWDVYLTNITINNTNLSGGNQYNKTADGIGISFINLNDSFVISNFIKEFDNGVYISQGIKIIIENNSVEIYKPDQQQPVGIYLSYISNSTVKNNNITTNLSFIGTTYAWWTASTFSYSIDQDHKWGKNNTIENNLMNNKLLYYNESLSNFEYNSSFSNIGAIICSDCNNITIKDLNLSLGRAESYIKLFNSTNIKINNVTFEHSTFTIDIENIFNTSKPNISITNSTFIEVSYGLLAQGNDSTNKFSLELDNLKMNRVSYPIYLYHNNNTVINNITAINVSYNLMVLNYVDNSNFTNWTITDLRSALTLNNNNNKNLFRDFNISTIKFFNDDGLFVINGYGANDINLNNEFTNIELNSLNTAAHLPAAFYLALDVGAIFNATLNNIRYKGKFDFIYSSSSSGNLSNITVIDSEINTTSTRYCYLKRVKLDFINVSVVSNVTSTITFGDSNSEIVRRWYLDTKANYSNVTLANKANISGYNISGNIIDSNLTDSSGNTRLTLIEYFQNSTGKYYYSNYSINATKSGWDMISQKLNLTTNSNLFFNLTDSINPLLTIYHPMSQSYTTNESLSLNFSAYDFGIGLNTCWFDLYNYTNNRNTLDQHNSYNALGIYDDEYYVQGDINISLSGSVSGTLNLLGYSSANSSNINKTTFKTSSGSIYTYAQAKSLGKISDINLTNDGTILLAEPTILNQGDAFWITAYENLTMTFPGIGGINTSVTFPWSNLRFSNGTTELNVTQAGSATGANWIDSDGTIQYYDGTDLVLACGQLSAPPYFCSSTNIDGWKGYLIYNNLATDIDMLTYNFSKKVESRNISCQNATFNVSDEKMYSLLLYANDSNGNINSQLVSFSVSTTKPAVILNSPTSEQWSNYTNIFINFTATQSKGIDTCKLYSDWNTWSVNYTWKSPTNDTMNFTQINLTDGYYKYNIWCNNTVNTESFALNNKSFGIDTILPVPKINTITTEPNKQTFSFDYQIGEINPNTCFYSIYINNTIDGLNNNVSMSCTSGTGTATTSDYGGYNLTIYVRDKAGNENSSTKSFTTFTSSGPGGGGGTPEPKIVEKIIPSNRTYCGDGICQNQANGFELGNDAGVIEDFYSCSQDCPGFNLETSIFACFEEDQNNQCIWKQVKAQYVGLGLGLMIAILSFTTVEDKRTKKQITLYKYTKGKIFKNNKTIYRRA